MESDATWVVVVWFKDGTYIKVYKDEAHIWETQPDYDRTEEIDS